MATRKGVYFTDSKGSLAAHVDEEGNLRLFRPTNPEDARGPWEPPTEASYDRWRRRWRDGWRWRSGRDLLGRRYIVLDFRGDTLLRIYTDEEGEPLKPLSGNAYTKVSLTGTTL